MEIIVANSSDKPIYEQIASQVKSAIISGELKEGEALPSIRSLACDLRVSVITTKRAYAELESQGFIESVQGKGSFVSGGNKELLLEEGLRQIEGHLIEAVRDAAAFKVEPQQLHEMLDVLISES